MPFVHIRLAAESPLGPDGVQHLQGEATRLLATVLRKKAELTAVLVEQAPLGGWSVGGATVHAAAHLDVKVTAGTNSPHEKEAFIAAAAQLLREVLGPALPVATYVVIHEVPANSWGYDGISQEARRNAELVAEAA